MALQDNGHFYDLLEDAVRQIKNVPGMTCEVGLREGGGSKHMIDALMQNADHNRVHITIDPYGSIDYIQSETQIRTDGPYSEMMMVQALLDLYGYVKDKPITVLFFALEDTEFFERYANGVPVYRNQKKEIINIYACTFIDGPHNLEHTMLEAKFFAERSTIGSVIVFDDIDKYYDHNVVRNYIESVGWKQLAYAPTKISYVRKQ